MVYAVRLIKAGEKEEYAGRYAPQVRYEVKSEIYGCCIKVLTDDKTVKERWEENFYFISQGIRSHGRLYVVADPAVPEDTVLYEPASKTAFLVNISYYGWIKSLALSVAGDVLEDGHGISSVHGACIDADGRGAASSAFPVPGRPPRPTGFSGTERRGLSPTTGSMPAPLATRYLPTVQRRTSISGPTSLRSGPSTPV